MAKAALIDISKCMGCRGCQVACKQWNGRQAVTTKNTGGYENPPALSASTWTRVEFYEGYGQWSFRKHQCMHCTEASCEAVCPSGAISHSGEVVLIDQQKCVGCGYCVVACPFDAVHRDDPRGTAQKCWFCFDRVSNGLTPACAKTCPPKAILFGDREEMLAMGSKRVQELLAAGTARANLYGEREVGGTAWLYVLPDRPSLFGLPDRPQVATTNLIANWLGGVITAGVVTVLPFWLLFRRRQELEKEKSAKRD